MWRWYLVSVVRTAHGAGLLLNTTITHCRIQTPGRGETNKYNCYCRGHTSTSHILIAAILLVQLYVQAYWRPDAQNTMTYDTTAA